MTKKNMYPMISVIVSIWLLFQATKAQVIWGLGALIIGIPLYFIMKKLNNNIK